MAFRITNIEEQFSKNQALSAIAPVQTEIETVKTSVEIARNIPLSNSTNLNFVPPSNAPLDVFYQLEVGVNYTMGGIPSTLPQGSQYNWHLKLPVTATKGDAISILITGNILNTITNGATLITYIYQETSTSTSSSPDYNPLSTSSIQRPASAVGTVAGNASTTYLYVQDGQSTYPNLSGRKIYKEYN